MRSIVKKNSIFIIAILNLLMFIITCMYYNNYIKEEYIKLHKVSLQNLNYIIEDTYKRF